MYNWSTDTTELKKDPKAYEIWRLEQMINFGLDGERISKKKLITYFPKLRIDPQAKRFLSFLLLGNQSSAQTSRTCSQKFFLAEAKNQEPKIFK